MDGAVEQDEWREFRSGDLQAATTVAMQRQIGLTRALRLAMAT